MASKNGHYLWTVAAPGMEMVGGAIALSRKLGILEKVAVKRKGQCN
jgi:hypothetical protein